MVNYSAASYFIQIFGEEKVNYRCIRHDGAVRNLNGMYTETIEDVLKQLNDQDYEVYFVANVGGYKNEDITRYVMVFLDLDCGRDIQGNYFPLEVVQKYKEDKLLELRSHMQRPTAIIETRNGLQSGWVLKVGATLDKFRECQERLIAKFNGDPAVKKPCNLLRVPGFMWCKNPNEKHPISIVELNEGLRYKIEDIINGLPKVNYKDERDNNKKEYNTLLPIVVTGIPSVNTVKLIKQRNIDQLQSIIQPEAVTFHTHDEVYDHLKRQDLAQLLGVSGKSFRCIFHDDTNPSAGIFVKEDTGHHIYCCQSSSCSFGSGTISKCIERLLSSEKGDVYRFLRKLYRITYHETDWQREQKAILYENKRYLFDHDFSIEYPSLYQMIVKYLPQLHVLLDFSRDHVLTENFATPDQSQSVFFASVRYLASRCGKEVKQIATRMSIFAYLGLLNKLSEDDIPESMHKRAKNISKQKNYSMVISFYSFPSFSEAVLTKADQRAKLFKEKGLTIRGWSREALLRAFGEQEADRVFPQEKGKTIPKMNQDVADWLEKTMLNRLAEKGWTREKEILDYARIVGMRKNFTEIELKRMIPEFLDGYALVKRKLNKDMKSELGITDNGYFEVIVRED